MPYCFFPNPDPLSPALPIRRIRPLPRPRIPYQLQPGERALERTPAHLAEDPAKAARRQAIEPGLDALQLVENRGELADLTGTVVGTSTYNAYRNPTAKTGTASTAFQFAGEYLDSESGAYYLRARYYDDPGTGQFLGRDPIGLATRALYDYTNDNPLNSNDPSGLVSNSGNGLVNACGLTTTSESLFYDPCVFRLFGLTFWFCMPQSNPFATDREHQEGRVFMMRLQLQVGRKNIDSIVIDAPDPEQGTGVTVNQVFDALQTFRK